MIEPIPIDAQLDELTDDIKSRLVDEAREVLKHAYCPYSNFPVGAAVLASDGSVFTGCNVENASYGLTICAERNAIAAAVAAGYGQDGAANLRAGHGKEDATNLRAEHTIIVAIAVATNAATPAKPCGACRQVISEFSSKSRPTIVLSADASGAVKSDTIESLLPSAFSLV